MKYLGNHFLTNNNKERITVCQLVELVKDTWFCFGQGKIAPFASEVLSKERIPK